MMLDYLGGDLNAFARVKSDHLDMWKMSGETMFRTFGAMNRIERKALSLCTGHILDIGAGSGCHTLYLQDKGRQVDAIDLSPGSVSVMKRRQVKKVTHTNLFSLEDQAYDTLLMLMNGIGIVGSLDGLNLFFQFVKQILTPKGQILMDSTDLEKLYTPHMLEQSRADYYGQTEFIMSYKTIQSDPFEWLYVDFETLSLQAGFHGFGCKKIIEDRTGKFLARITRME